MRPFHVAGRVETVHARKFFRAASTFFSQVTGVFLFLNFKVNVRPQLPSDRVGFGVLFEIVVCRTGNDQRCARFVDQNIVNFVHDGVIQRPLNLQLLCRLHVVAQVIEAELIAGTVGDVAGVMLLSFLRPHIRLNGTDRHPQVNMYGAHPFHVATCEVVVDRDYMNLAGDRVQKRR